MGSIIYRYLTRKLPIGERKRYRADDLVGGAIYHVDHLDRIVLVNRGTGDINAIQAFAYGNVVAGMRGANSYARQDGMIAAVQHEYF